MALAQRVTKLREECIKYHVLWSRSDLRVRDASKRFDELQCRARHAQASINRFAAQLRHQRECLARDLQHETKGAPLSRRRKTTSPISLPEHPKMSSSPPTATSSPLDARTAAFRDFFGLENIFSPVTVKISGHVSQLPRDAKH